MLTHRVATAPLALVVLIASCGTDRGTGPAEFEPQLITYGFVDETGTYGNVGAFIVKRPGDGHIFPYCTGTLISPTVFLTAAHCTVSYERELAPLGFTAFVSFDSPIPFGSQTTRRTKLIAVVDIVANPAYSQRESDSGDIAVLILPASHTHGITPATLPAEGLLTQLFAAGALQSGLFTAVGYGVQERVTGGGVPFFLDMNPIPRMYSFPGFNSLGPGYLRMSQNPSTGSGGTCFGDSGGPNFLQVNGVQILVATTVTGDVVCRSTNVTYRLDIASARKFLAAFVSLP